MLKPEPEIYELACQRLSVRPESCLYVGDGADNELAGAAAQGMTAVQLRSARPEQPGTRVLIQSMLELLPMLGLLSSPDTVAPLL